MPGDKVKLCMKQFAVLSRPGVDGKEEADQLGPLAGPLPHASRPSRTSAAPGPAALLTSAGPQLDRGPRAASGLPDRGDSKVNREAPALPGPPLGGGGGDAKCSASLASDTMFHVTSGAARLGRSKEGTHDMREKAGQVGRGAPSPNPGGHRRPQRQWGLREQHSPLYPGDPLTTSQGQGCEHGSGHPEPGRGTR